LNTRDKQLQQVFFQLGKLKGVIEEKDKQLQERKRGFFVRLFGRLSSEYKAQ